MRSQELLEHSGNSIEQIAAECGLSPLMLRRHFARVCGTTPQAYRRTFSQAEPDPEPSPAPGRNVMISWTNRNSGPPISPRPPSAARPELAYLDHANRSGRMKDRRPGRAAGGQPG
jgi:hypothetical protein